MGSTGNPQRLITIGIVAAPFGVKGEVKVQILTDFPQRFNDLRAVRLIGENSFILEIESTRFHKNCVLIKFKGIDTIEAADALRSARLVVDEDERVKLPPGSYFLDQIIGLKVYDARRDVLLGRVTEVIQNPANDVYCVTGDDGHEILIPAIKSVVKNIDLESGVMQVEMLEEY